jgi:hypothetical protein
MKKLCILNLIILSWCCVANAICPLCTIAVSAGIGFGEWLGIDDSITGVWIGGLIVSLIIWTLVWLDKKKIFFIGRRTVVILLYYLALVVPLFFADIIGHPANKLWGIDKLLLGIIFGSVFFLVGVIGHFILKKNHNNISYFPFQKVILPVGNLLILSGFFYLII